MDPAAILVMAVLLPYEITLLSNLKYLTLEPAVLHQNRKDFPGESHNSLHIAVFIRQQNHYMAKYEFCLY